MNKCTSVSIVLATLLASSSLSQAQEPQVVIYNNSGAMQFDAGGSNQTVLQEVQEDIAASSGIRVSAIIDGAQDTTKLNLALASSQPIDIVQVSSWTQYKSALMPITDLLKTEGSSILEHIPPEAWSAVTDADGQIWGIPRSQATNPFVTWVRQDLLDAAGLEIPTTIEELDAYMAAVKAIDPAYVAATRSWTREGFGDHTYATLAAFTPSGMSGEGAWQDPADGRVKPFILMPGVQDWLAWMKSWNDKGYWYVDSWSRFDESELLRTCNLAAWLGWYSRITLLAPQVQSNCPDMEWVRAPISGPQGEMASTLAGGPTSYVISRKSQNPEAAMRYLNWQFSNDTVANFATAQFGPQGKVWEFVDEATGTIEILDEDYGYAREFGLPLFPYETRLRVANSEQTMHYDYLSDWLTNLEGSKPPFDHDIAWDSRAMASAVPTRGDLQRLISENVVAFIVGSRPLTDFDAFVAEMDAAGMQDWINFMTEQSGN